MILDILENSDRYTSLHKGFLKAFEFLKRTDLKELPIGTYEIDSNLIYAMISIEQGRSIEKAKLETHERYIDIQFVISGIDTMGWKAKKSCTNASDDYNQNNDVQFFEDSPSSFVATRSNSFTIFFPEDAHMPLISDEEIHKVVIKIKA